MVEKSAPVTFGAYFSVKETSVFSFDDVVLSKGGFLDNKIVNVTGYVGIRNLGIRDFIIFILFSF